MTRTPAEILQVENALARYRESISRDEQKVSRAPVKPSFLTPLQLALSARAQGQPVATMRPDLRAALEAHLAAQETRS